MPLNVEVGSITQPGSTGNQTYTLATGFDPKVLLLTCVARTGNSGGSGHHVFSFGWATDRGGTAAQQYFCVASEDNIGTADNYAGAGSADIVKLTDGTTATVDLEIAFVEFQSNAFVLNWQNLHTTASVLVNYCVLGGDDILDALASSATFAGGATQDITVASGFGQPDLVITGLSWNGGDPPSSTNTDLSLGFGVKQGTANGRAIRFGSQDGATTQASNQAIYNNRALLVGNNAANEVAFQLSASSGWPTDGFEITYNTANSGFPFPYLAIRFSSDITVSHGESAAATSTNGTNTLTSSGTPKLAFLLNTRQTTANTSDTTSTNCYAIGAGFVDGSGNERYCGGYDDDGQGTASVCGTYQTNAKGIQTWLPSSDTLDGEADIAVSSSDFVATWTDAAPSAFLYEWFTLGEAGGALSETPIPGTATGAGISPTATIAATPTVGAATGAGTNPSARAAVTPGQATGAGIAPTASVSATPTVGTATAAGTAPSATATVTPGLATGTGISPTSTVTTTVGVASGAGISPAATISATPTVGQAASVGTTPGATISITPTVGTATGGGIEPTAGAPSDTTPIPGTATAVGISPTVTITATPTVGQAASTQIAPTPAISQSATGATATVVSIAPTARVAATPATGVANASSTAPTLRISATPTQGQAVGTGIAPFDPGSLIPDTNPIVGSYREPSRHATHLEASRFAYRESSHFTYTEPDE